MDPPDRIHFLDDDSSILKKISSQYSKNSKEYAALERAAFALWYVVTQDYDGFSTFVREWKSELTPSQRAHLGALGIRVE